MTERTEDQILYKRRTSKLDFSNFKMKGFRRVNDEEKEADRLNKLFEFQELPEDYESCDEEDQLSSDSIDFQPNYDLVNKVSGRN